jgi:hypothetical protein
MKQLPSEGSIPTDDWMLRLAADFKRRSDDIWANIEQGNNPQYIDWLERWFFTCFLVLDFRSILRDSFLVNHVMQSLSPNPQLKVRTQKAMCF